MNLNNMKEDFPRMPESMRRMVEQEVARQIKYSETGERPGILRKNGSPVDQRNAKGYSGRKVSGRKLAILLLAATMILGISAAAGAKVYRMYTEQVSDYMVKTGVKAEGTEADAIPDVDIRLGYVPQGLFQCDVCGESKYHFESTVTEYPHVGGVSMMLWVMDNDGDLAGIVEKNVVEQQELTIGGHEAVYLQKQKIDNGSIGYSRILYIMFPEVQHILQLYIGDDMPEEEMMKLAEGVELIPTGETLEEDKVYTWNDYVSGEQETETGSSKITSSREEMENLHVVGEEVIMPMYADTSSEEMLSTEDIRVKVTQVQTADDLSLLEASEYVEESWKRAVGADGKLLPDTVQYVKKGDGIDTVDEVVRTEEKAQKLVYVTLEYTNTGTEEYRNILFLHSMMAIAQQEDGYILYEQMKNQEDDDWDAEVRTGAASLGEMYYYDVHGGERHNNYIPVLAPGETVTIHIAGIVHEEELAYLYLNLRGAGHEFEKEALETGYVDIRQ